MTTVNVPAGTAAASVAIRATAIPVTSVAPEFQQRVPENIVRKLEQRVPGWTKLRGLHAAPPP